MRSQEGSGPFILLFGINARARASCQSDALILYSLGGSASPVHSTPVKPPRRIQSPRSLRIRTLRSCLIQDLKFNCDRLTM